MKTIRENSAADFITIALLQLMQKKPFDAISITELCEKAGVSRMSFYRSFDGKIDVLQKKAAKITDEFLERTHLSHRDMPLKDYYLILFRHLQENKDAALLLYRNGLSYIILDDMDRAFAASYRNTRDIAKAYFLSGGVYNVFLLWLKDGFKETPEQLADSLMKVLD